MKMKQKINNKYWGQYKNENDNWKSIKCSTYKKLKSTYPVKWENIKIYSRKIKGTRYELHTRNNSNKFAFNPNKSPQKNTGGKMTITHEFISEVFASLDVLKIHIGDNIIELKPDKILIEEKRVHIYCSEEKKYIDYYPDIFVYFSNDEKYLKKWGGRFAIEVNFTSQPSNTKRKHFQYLGIPLLELNVTDSIKFKYENKEFEDFKLNEYHKYLHKLFSNKIYLTQKYITYSNKYLGNLVFKISKKNDDLTNHILNLKKQSNTKQLNNDYKVEELENKISQLNSEKQILIIKNSNFEKRGLLGKIIFLIKKK